MAQRKLHHSRRIIAEHTITKSNLKPGMIVTFGYTGTGIRDNNPLVLFLETDDQRQLMHAINLNYLYENDVQVLFENISKKVSIKVHKRLGRDVLGRYQTIDRSPFIEFTKKFDPKKLYDSVIKTKLFTSRKTKNCYRTYKATKITNLKLVNYRLDIIEQEIRKQSQLSKHALSTPELYKAMEEQEVRVEIDNVRVQSQAKARKEARKDDN
jgi:hypothetical protein